MTRILIVDDDPVQLRLTAEIARRAGFVPVTATGGEEALRLMRGQPGFGAVILDLVMPDLDGMAVMEAMSREAIATPVIVQTAHSGMETIVTAMRKGAVDFFTKPVAPERLVVSLRNALKLGELETLVRNGQTRRTGPASLTDIVTRSPAMHRTLAQTQKAAKTLLPVLIEGESGTGRDLLARIICGAGERAGRPFIALNCASFSPGAMEEALFGTDAGPGRIAAAQGGTLLLDEIGELTPTAQARLLKLVADGQLEPVGATRPERANIRVIAATSTRLLNLAQAGDFREDLYYRLNVFPIYLPPLRERTEDIEPLARHFLTRSAAETGRRVSGLTEAALDLLTAYAWPGNVRQLEGAVHRAVALSEGGQLDAADFPQILALARGREEAERLTLAAPAPSAPVHIDAHRKRDEAGAAPDRFLDPTGEVAPLPDLERDLIAFAIQHYGGRMSKVARALRIGRSTLYRKLREYGLEDRAESDAA